MTGRIVRVSALLALGAIAGALVGGGPAAATALKAPSADPAACAKCHPRAAKEVAPTKHETALQSVQKTAGAGDACLKCHSTDYLLAPEGRKPSVKTARFGVTCTACHFDHQAKEGIDDRRPPLCEDCHSGGQMQLGQAPHHPQNEMMLGTSPPVTGVPKMPSMFGKKDCNGCHMPVIDGKRYHDFSVLMPDKQDYSCGIRGCHEGQGAKYTKLARDWRAQTAKALAEVKALLEAKKAKSQSEAYKVALFNCQFVESDRSQGVHNFPFAMKLLEVAKAKLAAL
ncbi:MAG: multiheme c-type cytochrome [Bacillota bacterium]|nr:multiheme c-type cytochrome [Bacillota bacterium]